MNILRTKPLDLLLAEKEKGSKRLARLLGPLDLTALGIGAIIGTGIFVLTGVASARYAGPGIVLSFIIAGLASAFAALVYAELASMIPVSGSAYTYTYTSLGEIVAWLIGWNLVLEYLVASGAVAIGWSSYFVNLLQSIGISIPSFLASSPFAGGIINLPATLIIALITILVLLGIRHSKNANNLVVALKLAAILLFIFLGVKHINAANWQPFLPFGIAGAFKGAAIIFFAYIGFDAVSTAAEEVKNPQRNLPIGIIASLSIATVLYILVAGILTGMVKYPALNTASPVATALLMTGIPWASAVVSVGALAGLTSVLLVTIYAQSRIFFAISRDGLLPPIFSKLHPHYNTPYLNTIVVGTAAALIGSFLPIGIVAELANIGTLTAFIAVSAGVLVLRYSKPDLSRPFRTPWMPWTALFSIISSFYLAINLPLLTWLRFVIWILIGTIIYFGYSRKHSLLSAYQKPPREVVFGLPAPSSKKIPPKDK